MHMDGNRLLNLRAQARAGSGQLAGLSWRYGAGEQSTIAFTDPYLDPPGLNDAFYREKSIRLPDSFWCYDPLTDGPEVNALAGCE